MAEKVSFCVNNILYYRDGVNHAQEELYKIQRKTEYRANEELRRAKELYKYVEYVLDTMDEDRKTAEAVREHNKDVLGKMEQDLTQLQRHKAELDAAYSRAYSNQQAAAQYETRVRNTSVRETGNSEIDHRNQQAHAKKAEDAHQAVRAADAQLAQVKQAQQQTDQQIQQLKEFIEAVKRTIQQLNDFIREIRIEIERVVEYRTRLQQDTNYLEWEIPTFSNVSHDSGMGLDNCAALSEKAIAHGRRICDCLDPDFSAGSHDDCYVIFSDVQILGRMAKDLTCVCDRCEDSEAEMMYRAGVYGNTMQDSVIYEASSSLKNLCNTCSREITELRDTARSCKQADVELRAYYDLKRFG